MAFVRRALAFRSWQAGRSWLAVASFAALLPGCGGDTMEVCPVIACVDVDKPTVSWKNQRYTIVTSPAGTEPVTLEAIVTVQGVYMMSTDAIVVEPNAPNHNPGPDAASYPVVVGGIDKQMGQAIVRFRCASSAARAHTRRANFRSPLPSEAVRIW